MTLRKGWRHWVEDVLFKFKKGLDNLETINTNNHDASVQKY